MQLPRVRFLIWRSIAIVASVGCFAAALVTFSDSAPPVNRFSSRG